MQEYDAWWIEMTKERRARERRRREAFGRRGGVRGGRGGGKGNAIHGAASVGHRYIL
jgi:hypothetical protein